MYQNQAIQHSFIGGRGDALKVVLDAGRRAALAVDRWHQRRKAIRELMALDDRTLRDINVRRDDIYWVTGQIFRRAKIPFTCLPRHRRRAPNCPKHGP